MPIDRSDELANVRTISQLVRFLRDEMDWPIDQGDFVDVEDLFYDFTAEELGIDPRTAAKIESIKRLRPLSTNQPWGIFFVKFEPKRLPVVALRRILGQVALKKRTSANRADRTAWEKDDLLFISNYGQGEERQISFAHFSSPSDARDLPTLKVLGWDSRDTKLHLDAVARELTGHLKWPEDDENVAAWRDQWRSAFTLGHREVITTSRELSIRLAELARNIRDRITSALAIETERGPLTKLMNGFREALVHDMNPDGFADMYAQTIAYGLLSARIADPTKKTTDDFAAHMRTNPFLRELMETFLRIGGRRGKAGGPGIDFDELGVSDVVHMLDDAKMEAVIRDFGDRNRAEDPVMHFYELFLHQYNKQLKIQRGVFYTPQPVVSYIVRSVHELLQTEFGLADGLADTTTWGEMLKKHPGLKLPPLTDEPGETRTISPEEPFVQILDPATGTATFLVEVIDIIHSSLAAKWKQQRLNDAQQRDAWNDYVPRHLLPRLHAFELMMAPYAIAHMKIGLKLAETGYRFGTEERARIYLTNALEPWVNQLPLIGFDALAHEAAAVNEIKRHKRFTVVIGNPPYSNFGQLNRIPFILGLLEDYKRGLDEKKLNLDDDFIKFVRFSQHLLDETGVGVFGMITNNVFIDGITHRRLRESLKTSFGDVRILDLHGSSKKREASPDGAKEENVFDIQQGVGISLLAKSPWGRSEMIRHAELWGAREAKYRALQATSACRQDWTTIACAPPHFFFVPKSFGGLDEYQSQPSIAGDVFSERNAGVQTKRDGLVYSFTKEELEATLSDVRSLTGAALAAKYELPDDGRDWAVEWAKQDVRKGDGKVIRVAYHPFDLRWTYFTGRTKGFMAYPRTPLMWSALQPNRLLLAVRNPRRGNVDSFFVGGTVVDKDAVSPFDNVTFFPLYTYPDPRTSQHTLDLHGERRSNLAPTFLHSLSAILGLPRQAPHGLPAGLTPEDIFDYAYAVFHSPGYRSRYAEFLKIDFPRLPLTGKLELLRALARLGGELSALHLLESPRFEQPTTEFIGGRNPEVQKVSWSRDTVWVDKAQTTGFRVREPVWNFRIGGYQVCEKWLKDRGPKKGKPGRTLSDDDISHYQKIVVAISETIRLMKEIDEVIEEHGGWPGAFMTSVPAVESREALPAATMKSAASALLPFRPRTVEPSESDRYVTCVPIFELAAAAGAFGEAQHVNEDSFEWVAVDTRRRLRRGMFVAQVVGRSMEPTIPDGSYCLFSSPVEGTREGRTVLVELRDARDPETGQRYTVKRYESVKRAEADLWQHESITLKPINPEFEPIHLTSETDNEYQVIAEFLEVLREQADEDAAGGHKPTFPAARFESRPGAAVVEPVEEIELDDDAADVLRVDVDDLDRDEVICLIRQIFGDGVPRSRDAAIRELARALGYARTGSRVSKVLDNALVTAVRRGVLANIGGDLKLEARRIDEYDRDFLKAQFLASLDGRAWKDRADSIRDFARWMGFRRTGAVIDETARSLIKGLLREGRLEARDTLIRRCG